MVVIWTLPLRTALYGSEMPNDSARIANSAASYVNDGWAPFSVAAMIKADGESISGCAKRTGEVVVDGATGPDRAGDDSWTRAHDHCA